MAKSSRSGFPFAKTITVLASIFGISLGLCGMNLILLHFGIGAGHGGEDYFGGPILSVLGIVELAGMLISGPLLVIAVIAWVIAGAIGNRGGSEPQKLFDDSKADSEIQKDPHNR